MDKYKMVRLGDIVEKPLSGEWGNENKTGTGVPVLRTTNFTDEGIIDYTNVVFREISQKKFETKALKYGDIIIEKSGGSDTKPVGRVVYYDGAPRQYIYNNFTASLRVNTDAVDTRYVFLFLFYYYKIGITARFENKTTGIHNLRLNDFLDQVKIPLPPLDEQKRIAKNLDLASEIVKGYKDQLAEMDKLVQAVFYEMFGDPVTNEKGWDSKPLSKTTQIVTGNTPPRNCKDNYGHCIEWIKTDNITDALYVTQASEYLSECGAAIGRLVDADAILMACIAGSIKSIGRVAIANRMVAFNQQINAIIANEYDTLFLYWLFKMTQKYIQSTINMSLKGILSKGKLEKLVFIAPPLSLQAHFSSIVTEIEAQKAQIQQALTEAENLFNSLMQEYFE